jgi:glycosyltransferase involved in cell wall biosynthesis
MRIAHVLNTMGLGGVSAVAYELLRRLPADRYEHVVYALRRAADNPEARAAQVERFTALGATVRFPRDDAKKFTVVAELCEWLREDAVDVLHTHSYKPNVYGRIAGSLHGGPRMVAHYHNVYDDKWAADGTRAYDELLAPRTDRLVACSQAVADHLALRLGLDRSRVDVVPNGVDAERFAAGRGRGGEVRERLGVPAGAPLVGTVGRVSRQKAQEVFLAAAALVRERRPDAHFVVAGGAEDAPLLEALHAQAAALGLTDSVRFAGHVADMPALYDALDVLAAPSRWEGLPLTLVEALAAGTPVVATDIPPIREATGDGAAAVLVGLDDPAALAAGVLGVLSDRRRAQELAGRGRAVAARRTWERSAAALDDLYAHVAAGAAPAAAR